MRKTYRSGAFEDYGFSEKKDITVEIFKEN